MIKHIQQDTSDTTGSCFATCIASILGISLDKVPNFRAIMEEDDTYCMVVGADKWLRKNHNKRLISIELYNKNHTRMIDRPVFNRIYDENDLVILFGRSPRKTKDGRVKYHAVVGKPEGWGFEIVHDPHPDGGGIDGEPYAIHWIVKI